MRFNPLPTRKARRTQQSSGAQTHLHVFQSTPNQKGQENFGQSAIPSHFTDVSIHSQPERPGELFLSIPHNRIARVSIHSQPERPGEPGRQSDDGQHSKFQSTPNQKGQENASQSGLLPVTRLFQSTPNQKGQENFFLRSRVICNNIVSIHSQPERPGEHTS